VKILIVDDDEDLNKMLARFLEKHGYQVFSAGDALQAMDVVDRIGPDLVITDLMMPVVDGLVFLEMLKADPKRKNLPVIFITAHPDTKKADASMRKGAAFFLAKPIDFDQLLAIIKFAE
jgi:two-component system, chemotaxis family, chemotaxis protein CheY